MSFLDAALSAGGRLGRYFSVVTLVPTAALVGYLYILACSGAGTRHFDLGQGLVAVSESTWKQAVGLLAVALLLGLITHPLQFPLTQLLEGYWGTSQLGITMTTARVRAHRARATRLATLADEQARVWKGGLSDKDAIARMNTPEGDHLLRAYLSADAADKAGVAFPNDVRRIMPTRLGNILRRHEDLVGAQYGLDAITVYPHLSHLAGGSRTDQAFDEVEQMDLALRLCLSAALATVITLVLLARSGGWVFLALLPYTGAYLAYRGACVAANSWMQAVQVMVDLDRFALYDALHLPRPASHVDESRSLGPDVTDMLSGKVTPLLYEIYDEVPQERTT